VCQLSWVGGRDQDKRGGVFLIGDDAYEGGNLLSFVSIGDKYSKHDPFAIMVMMPVITWSFSDLWCSWQVFISRGWSWWWRGCFVSGIGRKG